jgi:DNA segregation ATPase FtsK/SpoIIIE-like protein
MTHSGKINTQERYEQILATFGEHGIPVKRSDCDAECVEGPGFYVARVKPGRGVRPRDLENLLPALKLALGLPKELNPRSTIDRGAVVLEIPKADEDRYYVSAEDLWARSPVHEDRLYAPLGEDIDGDVVGIAFGPSHVPHLLIGGTTGSGKSIALETLLMGLCTGYGPKQLELVLIDPKGTEMIHFENAPHLLGTIGHDAEDAIDRLEEAVAEMQRRYRLLKSKRVRTLCDYNKLMSEDKRLPWRLIVLDEYADLAHDANDRKAIEKHLGRLAQKARASGIHVIVATQKPSAKVLSTSIRSNLPAQLALRTKTASDSRVIMDETGAEALAGKGDGFLKTAGATVRIQCAKVDRPEDMFRKRIKLHSPGRRLTIRLRAKA